jgi:hypothetical protein
MRSDRANCIWWWLNDSRRLPTVHSSALDAVMFMGAWRAKRSTHEALTSRCAANGEENPRLGYVGILCDDPRKLYEAASRRNSAMR